MFVNVKREVVKGFFTQHVKGLLCYWDGGMNVPCSKLSGFVRIACF